MKATVTTAVKLSAAQKKKLTDTLQKKYSKSLSLDEVINKDVIGGIKVTIGSEQYDLTLLHKLAQVQEKLLNI